MEKSISLYPATAKENAYIQLMQEILQELGYDVRPARLRSVFREGGSRDFFALNWLENVATPQRTFSLPRALLALLVLVTVKLRWKSFINVQHNLYSHDATPLARHTGVLLGRIANALADITLVHSPHFRGRKGHCYVPHPLYPTAIASPLPDVPLPVGADFCLVFGQIRPYKGIDGIIRAWPAGQKLVVAGPASDKAYLKSLQMLAMERSIAGDVIFVNRYLDEAEVAALMTTTRACLLGHSGPEMIVSGAFFHAISYGAHVIACPSKFLNSLKSEGIFSEFDIVREWNELGKTLSTPRRERNSVLAQAEAAFGREAVKSALAQALLAASPVSRAQGA